MIAHFSIIFSNILELFFRKSIQRGVNNFVEWYKGGGGLRVGLIFLYLGQADHLFLGKNITLILLLPTNRVKYCW